MDTRKKAMGTVFAAIIVVSVFTFAIPSIASESYAAENATDRPSSSEANRISLTQDVKSNLSETQKKLSTDLLPLLDSRFLTKWQDRETLKVQMERLGQYRLAGSVSPTGEGTATDDLVYVYVYLKPPAATETIEPYVWEVRDRDEENHLAVAWVAVQNLESLASLEEVRTIRTVMPPLVRTGSVTTEGDAIHRTSDVRATYSQSGSGMKVGIISDGVDHWTSARNSGDLPADLTVLNNRRGGDEGTAMLEIVHDMAPDADLYFHDSGTNEVAFNAAIDALVAAGCAIICDDIGWLLEPYFEDGIVASHVTSVLASNNIIYVSSAGNDGDSHYQGYYYNDGENFHDFSSCSEPVYKYLYVNIPKNGEVTVVLQWNDRFGYSSNNYDLYLYKYPEYGQPLKASIYPQNGDDDPLEAFTFTNTLGYTIEAEIDILNYNGAAAAKTLEVYIITRNGASVYTNNINPADSIFGHPAVPGVIAAGAIDARDPGNDDIEFFSSRGPVTISYPSPVSRPKPDLCGVDGVKITGAGGFGSWDGSNYRFFGTSAAAPHIAAIAAQIWGASPNATADEVRNCLYSTAVDLGDSGTDYVYGYGRADAFDAYNCIAPISAPTVTTNAATSVEETTATLNGVISNDGGEACQYRFEYDTHSGEPYTYNTGWTGSKTTGQSFSASISSLAKGTTYYVRAQAKNSAGTASGSELTFLTKPDAPTSFSAAPAGTTQINLSWTKGSGAQKTKIQRKQGSYPSNKDDGTQVYFDTGTTALDTGLTPGTTYYYRAWSYVQGSEQWSDTCAQAAVTTPSITPPAVTTNVASSVTTTSARLHGNLTDTGGESCQVWFEYGKTTAYSSSTPPHPLLSPSTFSAELTDLEDNTTYLFRAAASNSNGSVYGDDISFTTFDASYTGLLDTGTGAYPSIPGTHRGTIRPYQTINVSNVYIRPCTGTGGHTEYIHLYGNGVNQSASWGGYYGDWQNLSFGTTFSLEPNKTYYYELKTGSYPLVIHESRKDG